MIVNLLLSVLSGAFSALSFNILSFSFLVWFSFVPLLYILHRINGNQEHQPNRPFGSLPGPLSRLFAPFSYKAGKISGYFFIAGIVHCAITIFWLNFVTRLGTFLLVFYLALYWVFFGLGSSFLIVKRWSVITIPALWVVMEFLRENFPYLGFGWINLGYSQYTNLFLVQVADIFGVKLISFLIMTTNMVTVKFLQEKKIILRYLVYAAILLLISLGYSAYRLNNLEIKQSVVVSIVQPNIDQRLKWDPRARGYIISTLGYLSNRLKDDSILIYPEASWPTFVDREEEKNIQRFVRNIDKDILLGAVTKEEGKFYNSAILIGRDGSFLGRYRKIKLVPFGEYVPLRSLLSFVNVLSAMGDLSPGVEHYVFEYEGKKMAVLICFEDSFPILVSRLARMSDFVVNITNDAWFKGDPQASQHLAIMVFRAIENRISIVRSANTGISAYVDFLGRIDTFNKDKKKLFVAGTNKFRVAINRGSSFYNKYTEIFPFMCFLIILWPIVKRR